MLSLSKHIILIGFKHVGKSVIGESLAKKLYAPFIDLDKKIEFIYEKKFNKKYNCREIMQNNGEQFFRDLETKALSEIVNNESSVIALGGGTPLCSENQKLIQSNIVVHIMAHQDIVYKRILISGQPAFFNSNESFLESFKRLWNERIDVYQKIQNFSIDNDNCIDEAVQKILKTINLESEVRV